MITGISRRQLLRGMGAAALMSSARPAAASEGQARPFLMPTEGNHTPKICLGVAANLDAAGMRRVKQLGVDYVLTGGPKIPWTEEGVRSHVDRFRAGGLTLCNLMISGFNDVIWGKPGADAQIADVIT